jgi:hypothetical protein
VFQKVGNIGLALNGVAYERLHEADEVFSNSDKEPVYVPCSESENYDSTCNVGVDALVTEGKRSKHNLPGMGMK